MQYREIITKSWELTRSHRYLNWLAAIPLAIEFVLAVIYLPLRWGMYIVPDILSKTYNFVEHQYSIHQTGTTTFLVMILITIILYLLVPTFCEGALIGTIAKIIQDDKAKVKKQFSIAYGLNVYLPLVELHAMTSILNPLYVILSMSLLHQFNEPLFDLFIWPALGLFIIEIFINLSVIYAKYELVIFQSGILDSMKKSIKVVFFHITETFFILMLLLLIVLRAIVNLLIVFLIPAIIYGLATYFLSFIAGKMILYVLIALGSLVAYYYAIKTASMLWVFVGFAFVMTYLELASKNEDKIINTDPSPVATTNTQSADIDALQVIGASLMKEMDRISQERKQERIYTIESSKEEPKQIMSESHSVPMSDNKFHDNTEIVKDTFTEDVIDTDEEDDLSING